MSAAEKLRALERGRAGFPTDQRHVGDSSVIAVLPQIVAVLSACEAIQRNRVFLGDFPELDTALAALDEKLS